MRLGFILAAPLHGSDVGVSGGAAGDEADSRRQWKDAARRVREMTGERGGEGKSSKRALTVERRRTEGRWQVRGEGSVSRWSQVSRPRGCQS